MTVAPEFCAHPGDHDGCQCALVDAWSSQCLAEHCIIKGLELDWEQCRDVLLQGLRRASRPSGPSQIDGARRDIQSQELLSACETALLRGYEAELKAAIKVFMEAYHRLVRSTIHRFRIGDAGVPSADDVYQDVFLGLHRFLSKGAHLRRTHLSTFIWRVTCNACAKALKQRRKEARLEMEHAGEAQKVWLGLPPRVIEIWEDFDERLCRSNQGDLINRIMLAQWCVQGRGGKYPPRELLVDWQRLADSPAADIKALYDAAAEEIKRFPQLGPVLLTADFLNTDLAESWQLPVVFAAGAGADFQQTQGLLNRLNKLSANAVCARSCRIRAALRQQESAV